MMDMGAKNKTIASLLVLFCLTSLILLPNTAVKAQTDTFGTPVQAENPLVTFSTTLFYPAKNVTYANDLPLDCFIEVNNPLSLPVFGLWSYYKIDNNSEVYFSTLILKIQTIDISNLTNGIHNLTILAREDYVYDGTHYINKQEVLTTSFSVLNTFPNPTVSEAASSSVPEFSLLTILPLLFGIPIVLFVIRKIVSWDRKYFRGKLSQEQLRERNND